MFLVSRTLNCIPGKAKVDRRSENHRTHDNAPQLHWAITFIKEVVLSGCLFFLPDWRHHESGNVCDQLCRLYRLGHIFGEP